MIIQRRLMVVLAANLRCVSHKLSVTILPLFLPFTKMGSTLSTDTSGGNNI
jgi:hypothetical protein